MVERGDLKAEYLTVESEHSAMASVVAASQVGPEYSPLPAPMVSCICMRCCTGCRKPRACCDGMREPRCRSPLDHP